MELTERIEMLKDQELKIKADLNNLILSMPDNPDIQRISEHPRVFTVMFSDVVKTGHMNLSPYFYDWKYQYQKLVEKINATDTVQIVSVLEGMISKGSFTLEGDKIQLHPTIIKQLKSIL